MSNLQSDTLEELEIRLLLDGIEERYGYDFREYRPAYIRKQVRREAKALKLETISRLQEKLLRSHELFEQFLKGMAESKAFPFEPARFFRVLREQIFPLLGTYPSVRVWYTGGDVCGLYSLAILLEEAGLAKRTQIYFTDLSEKTLEAARDGKVPENMLLEAGRAYREAGGRFELGKYLVKGKAGLKFRASLRRNMVFFPLNPATDSSFNEFNVIVCRGTLANTEEPLRGRLCQLFHDSLCLLGVLAVGDKESPMFGVRASHYRQIKKGESFYQKVS